MNKWTPGQLGKTKPIQSQNKPNSNPIYPVVASGEAGTKPILYSPDCEKLSFNPCFWTASSV